MSEDEPITDSDIKVEEEFEQQSNWTNAFPPNGSHVHPPQPLSINTDVGLDGTYESPILRSAVRPRSSERVPIPPASSTQQPAPTGPMSAACVVPPR